MDERKLLKKRHRILQQLCHLPKHILRLHGTPNASEFVLHDLCDQNCFDLQKAAYFVDNPDFDCVKGITGYSKAEAYVTEGSIWDEPERFSTHMQGSPFNQQVKNLSLCSIAKSDRADKDIVDEIAHGLDFSDFSYCTWHSKHDNHGFLVYEKPTDGDDFYFLEGSCLLGLCPIF
ncbi:hypothetical protein HRU45_00785 [Candidatus Dependentiae bacterium]|nr:hypothetical protein [Candidatus Dependentiae bacterium]